MPSKQAPHTRTRTRSREQPRAWGTRYDSLGSSPPPAISSPPTSSPTTSPTPGGSVDRLAQAHALSLELFGANAAPSEKRDWADDEVTPSASFTPVRAPLVLDIAAGSIPARKDAAKLPHNASVFVGSLPPNTDEEGMAQLLAQHLVQFAAVQSIKIVHDSKGGLCAFVQCENAIQAAQLVAQAQSNPQPFMGRYLRYENARARRTLWISYRIPVHFMPCASQDEDGTDIVLDDNGIKGRWIESDLPDALRIWKPRDARFPVVSYRSEARNIGDNSRLDKEVFAPDVALAFRPKGVLFTDLKFDAQTIKSMAEAFGPLESFKPYLNCHSFEEETNDYPADHNGERSPCMDLGVWEVKWGHRDDCITALNTLRKIPHLSVTWAKDFAYPQTPRSGFLRTPTSPRYASSYSPREAISPIARGRPFLLLDCTSGVEGGFRGRDTSSSTPTFVRSPNISSPQKGASRLLLPLARHKNESAYRVSEGEETDDGWTVVRPQNITRNILSSLVGSTTENSVGSERSEAKAPEWNEGDFPPLKTGRVSRDMDGETVDKVPSSPAVVSLTDPTLPLSSAEYKTETDSEDVIPEENGNCPDLPHPVLMHRRSMSNPTARMQKEDVKTSPKSPTLEISLTPELVSTTVSQTPTSAQQGPESPVHSVHSMAFFTASDRVEDKQNSFKQPCIQDEATSSEDGSFIVDAGRREHQGQPAVDPKTIFVGGLEPFGPRPWDEPRLREIFEKYGEVKDIRIVNPMSKKTGFAFVTFKDEQSTLKAIREEHNRSYDGRQIRVQIRDMFPPRGGFKFRGRGIVRRPFGFEPRFPGVGQHNNLSVSREHGVLALSNASQSPGHHLGHSVVSQDCAPFRVIPPHIVPSISAESDSLTLHSSTSFESKPELDISQGTDSRSNILATPPMSAQSAVPPTSSAAIPMAPQSMSSMQMGFYPPHGWAPPYGTQMHYAMPYSPYGTVMPSVPMQFAPAAQPTDQNTVSGSHAIHWGAMYRAGLPFSTYPYMIMPPVGTDSSSATSQPTTPVKGQPPLHATGFIQGEHGTLIPVYQPDALDEYMSGSSPTQGTVRTRTSTTSSGPSSAGQQYPTFVAPQMWQSYPPVPPFFAYPVAPPLATSIPTSSTPPASAQHPQVHVQPLQTTNISPHSYISPGLIATSHPAVQQHPATHMGHTSAPSTLPPYVLGAPPVSAGTVQAMPQRCGSHIGQTSHGPTLDRSHTHFNKHPPRRDAGFYHGRNGQRQGRGPGTNFGGQSPSSVRQGSGSTPRGDHQYSNNSFQQLQRQVHGATAPPLHLGPNKHIPDGGHMHQNQWMANYQH